jgi:hypothetical protein
MSRSIAHPRRLGFVVFNVVAVGLLALWFAMQRDSLEAGIAGLPTAALTSTAIAVLIAVWIGCWIAWSLLVWSRARRR